MGPEDEGRARIVAFLLKILGKDLAVLVASFWTNDAGLVALRDKILTVRANRELRQPLYHIAWGFLVDKDKMPTSRTFLARVGVRVYHEARSEIKNFNWTYRYSATVTVIYYDSTPFWIKETSRYHVKDGKFLALDPVRLYNNILEENRWPGCVQIHRETYNDPCDCEIHYKGPFRASKGVQWIDVPL